MGDRTYVNIQIRKIDLEWLARALTRGNMEDFYTLVYASEYDIHGELAYLGAEECNYANWDELEGLLKEHFIDHDKQWERGYEYSAGTSKCRNINGEMVTQELYEAGEIILEFIRELRAMDSKERDAAIDAKYRKLVPMEMEDLV